MLKNEIVHNTYCRVYITHTWPTWTPPTANLHKDIVIPGKNEANLLPPEPIPILVTSVSLANDDKSIMSIHYIIYIYISTY